MVATGLLGFMIAAAAGVESKAYHEDNGCVTCRGLVDMRNSIVALEHRVAIGLQQQSVLQSSSTGIMNPGMAANESLKIHQQKAVQIPSQ